MVGIATNSQLHSTKAPSCPALQVGMTRIFMVTKRGSILIADQLTDISTTNIDTQIVNHTHPFAAIHFCKTNRRIIDWSPGTTHLGPVDDSTRTTVALVNSWKGLGTTRQSALSRPISTFSPLSASGMQLELQCSTDQSTKPRSSLFCRSGRLSWCRKSSGRGRCCELH